MAVPIPASTLEVKIGRRWYTFRLESEARTQANWWNRLRETAWWPLRFVTYPVDSEEAQLLQRAYARHSRLQIRRPGEVSYRAVVTGLAWELPREGPARLQAELTAVLPGGEHAEGDEVEADL